MSNYVNSEFESDLSLSQQVMHLLDIAGAACATSVKHLLPLTALPCLTMATSKVSADITVVTCNLLCYSTAVNEFVIHI